MNCITNFGQQKTRHDGRAYCNFVAVVGDVGGRGMLEIVHRSELLVRGLKVTVNQFHVAVYNAQVAVTQ